MREKGEGLEASSWRHNPSNSRGPIPWSGWLQVGLVVQITEESGKPEAGKKVLLTRLVEGGAEG